MLLPTHLLAGQTAYLVACLAATHPPAPAEALTAVAASALPDLDCRQGLVGRLAPPLSDWLEHRFGHRTVTHSLLLQAVAGLLAWWLLPTGYLLALLAGLLSHTLCDMMTPSGVAWFWPNRARCVLPGNERYRMQAMGNGELVFALLIAVLGVGLMHLSRVEAGTTGLIRAAIGNLAAAREDYDTHKGGIRWALKVEGRDNRTLADISGRYPVIGPYRESGFILETEAGPRSICRAESCDWYASHAVLVRAGAEKVKTAFFRTGRITAGALLQALEPWAQAGRVYLIGTFKAPGIRNEPPTVEVAGESVTLRHASPDVLKGHAGLLLKAVDLSAQLRYPGSEAVPEIGNLQGTGTELHPLLRKWVGKRQNLSGTGFTHRNEQKGIDTP